MHIIKAIPEDFVVKEVGSLQPTGTGPYAYFLLRKRNWNTIDALQAIGAKINVDFSNFGWSGNKDKHAVTEQVCSVRGVSADALEKASVSGIIVTYLGQSGRPIALGSHEGNAFSITVRNLESQPTFKQQFINLYGEQRFSSHNSLIGRALVKKQFDVVVEHLLTDPDRAVLLRQALAKHPKDTVGALRHVPHTLMTLYVHAYQGALWNSLAQMLNDTKAEQQELPLIGFGTTDADIKKFPLIAEQLKAEAITPRDFIIRSIPSLSAEGGTRHLYATARGVEVGKLTDDELHAGKKKITVDFALDKGSYATEFIAQSLGNS